jgi:hypothetical protein
MFMMFFLLDLGKIGVFEHDETHVMIISYDQLKIQIKNIQKLKNIGLYLFSFFPVVFHFHFILLLFRFGCL